MTAVVLLLAILAVLWALIERSRARHYSAQLRSALRELERDLDSR